MAPVLTAEDVVRRIAAECALVDENGGHRCCEGPFPFFLAHKGRYRHYRSERGNAQPTAQLQPTLE